MNKLLNLKKWLSLDEAAEHLSNVLGEPATVADLYRFALDGHLMLSVDLVNHAQARIGTWLKTEQVEFDLIEYDSISGEKLDVPFSIPINYEIRVSKDDWIKLEKPVVSIKGVWDLTMNGAEHLDIEHCYQQLTSGLEVTLMTLDGAFLQQGDIVCQLQQDFDNNEFQKGSKAQQKDMELYIATNDINDDEINMLRNKFKTDREEYLNGRRDKPKEDNYYPAGGLGDVDHVLVIRTKEITRFIQSLEDTPVSDKPLTSKERNSLLVLIGALCKEVDIAPNKRGVTASLVAMTEVLGAPLSDDTIRKILSQIEDAVSLRNK